MKLLLVLMLFGLILFLFNTGMSKLLHVKRRGFFSIEYVNERHRSIDLVIRFTFVLFLIIGFLLTYNDEGRKRFWIFEPYYLLLIFIIGSETVRGVMEWKYAENRKESIVTFSQLVFSITVLITMFATNFFGWFG